MVKCYMVYCNNQRLSGDQKMPIQERINFSASRKIFFGYPASFCVTTVLLCRETEKFSPFAEMIACSEKFMTPRIGNFKCLTSSIN